MKVLVVGASGAIGSRLVPQLLERGHQVVGTCHSSRKTQRLRELGAEPVVLDALDAQAVREVVARAEPEVVIYQATALADVRFSRNFDRAFAQTNRLRTEGTDNLLDAARVAGVRRFVAQSFASMRNAREGGMVKTEEDPLDPDPPATMRMGQAAMHHLDQAVTEAGGIALRYGGFYGAANDALVGPVRKRQFPIVGDGGGYSSWVHLDDAAAATVLAIDHDGPAIYNITDDEPAPLRRMAARTGGRARRQAAPPHPRLAGATDRGRPTGPDGNRRPRRLERKGQARAGLDPPVPELAARLRRGLRKTHPRDGSQARPHASRRRTRILTSNIARVAPGSHGHAKRGDERRSAKDVNPHR